MTGGTMTGIYDRTNSVHIKTLPDNQRKVHF